MNEPKQTGDSALVQSKVTKTIYISSIRIIQLSHPFHCLFSQYNNNKHNHHKSKDNDDNYKSNDDNDQANNDDNNKINVNNNKTNDDTYKVNNNKTNNNYKVNNNKTCAYTIVSEVVVPCPSDIKNSHHFCYILRMIMW